MQRPRLRSRAPAEYHPTDFRLYTLGFAPSSRLASAARLRHQRIEFLIPYRKLRADDLFSQNLLPQSILRLTGNRRLRLSVMAGVSRSSMHDAPGHDGWGPTGEAHRDWIAEGKYLLWANTYFHKVVFSTVIV
jgi:hypothetical protein